MKRHGDQLAVGAGVTRRGALAFGGSLLLHHSSQARGYDTIGPSEGNELSSLNSQPPRDEFRKIYTEPEQVFIARVVAPAGGVPGKSGEESNSAYCHWLIGRQPPLQAAKLRLIYELTNFCDRYPKETIVGVINTIRVVDPQNRLFESYSAIARVRSRELEPRVLLTAAVEERSKTGSEDVALIHFVTRKFIYSDKAWSLVESRVFRVG